MADPDRISNSRWVERHDRLLILSACTLCVSPVLKFAEIQALELVYAVDMIVVLTWLLLHPEPVRIFRPFFRLTAHWLVFALLCTLLSVVALQRDFYIGPTVSALKGPFASTLSRIVELILDLFSTVYIASRCREDERLRKFTLSTYFGVGLLGCAWGAIQGLVAALTGNLGTYRMTGFNPEGGPFGVYLTTVMMTLVAIYQQGWIKKKSMLLCMGVFFVCLLASKSKAALFEIVVLIVLLMFLRLKPVAAFSTSVLVVVVGASLFQALGLTKPALAYYAAAQQYRSVSWLRPTDGNFVIGRIAGVYLAPKMIAAHPLTGIGLGNYPIVRDDPIYRQGGVIVAPPIDSPSLGLIDYLVDLGVPLFLYMTILQLAPAVAMLRKNLPTGTVALALVVPVSVWFGAHLNLTYPWIALAMALALSYPVPRLTPE